MADAVFETVNLSKCYGNICALAGLSVSAGPGRVIALLGPNGAGKTTLLKLLLGHLEPTQGRAMLFGEPARALSPRTASRVASLIDRQEPPKLATLGLLTRLQAAASPTFNHAWFAEQLASLELKHPIAYGLMSKGQRRQVLANLCLASGADLLMLDEPAEGLDTSARRHLYDVVRKKSNDAGTTIFIATHNIHDIERVADDVVLLVKGKLVLHEALETLREQMREVIMPLNIPATPLVEGAEILRKSTSAGMRSLHVRLPEGKQSALEDHARPLAEEHYVDLENLYLALSTPAEEEVA